MVNKRLAHQRRCFSRQPSLVDWGSASTVTCLRSTACSRWRERFASPAMDRRTNVQIRRRASRRVYVIGNHGRAVLVYLAVSCSDRLIGQRHFAP